MYGMKRSELRVVPYDPAWREDFLVEKRRILEAAGPAVAAIEHVGSTAIPTVCAKPILDIAILCGAGGVEAVAAGLQLIGYEYRGLYDDLIGRYYAVLDDGDVRLCQAHIYLEPTDDWKIKLLFRDVLRRDRELAREYNEYKLALARTSADKFEYAETKTLCVDDFLLKVKAHAAEIG